MKPELAELLEKYTVYGLPAYAFAFLTMSSAICLRVALNPVLGESAANLLQALALLLVASLAGLKPSLFAFSVAFVVGWVVIPPYDVPFEQKIAERVAILIGGVIICVMTSAMRTTLLTSIAAKREAEFLSREMNHRVRNLFAVVASMVTLSARNRPQAQETLMELRARVQSLSDAHDVAVHESDLVDFRELVDRLVAPYRRPGSGEPRVLVDGEDVDLPYGHTTPMALIFHELATNAVKYGALATPDGYVRLFWRRQDRMLEINWQEHGTLKPAEPGPDGFGTVLVEASVAQMRGTIERELNGKGLVMRLTVPAAAPEQKQFQTNAGADRQSGWNLSRSSLSAHLASKRFFRRKPAIRNSRF